MNKYCLFVEGIATKAENYEVISMFKKYGKCYVKIRDDWAYAFVRYEQDEDASKALKKLDGS